MLNRKQSELVCENINSIKAKFLYKSLYIKNRMIVSLEPSIDLGATMKPDTLNKKIAENALRKQRPQNIHRAVFLALREEIITAINDGWRIVHIWETLHDQGKISFSYSTFTVYVNKLIFHKKPKQRELHSETEPQQNQNITAPNLASESPISIGLPPWFLSLQEVQKTITPDIDSQLPISIDYVRLSKLLSCLDWPSPTS